MKPNQKKVTHQTRNKKGEGNKFKTDRGSQAPHVHDENHKNIQQRSLKLLNIWIRLHWHDFSSSAVMSLLNKFMN